MDTTEIPIRPHARLSNARPKPDLRELDYRRCDGIGVWLRWSPATNRVSITVEDSRCGESLTFEVAPGEALAAFHHPYAYASVLSVSPSTGVTARPRQP